MDTITFYTVILQFFTELDLILKNYVYNGYGALASYMKAPLASAVVLYIAIMGLSVMQGWIEMSMRHFVKSMLKISLIYFFAMQWDVFSDWIVNGLEQTAGEIGTVLISATPIPLPHFGGEGINGAIQSVLIEVTKIGAWTWNTGSWHNMGPCFTALLIWGFGYVMLMIGIFEIVLAKLMLALLFTLAPLFITFTLFKPTHGFFDRWVGAIVGFALLIIFTSAILGLALNIMQWAIGGMYLDQATHVNLVSFIPVMIVGCIGIGILLRAAHLAQAIGGTITTSSGSALLAGTVGGIVGGAMSSLSQLHRGAQMGLNAGATTAKIGSRLLRGSGENVEMMRQRLFDGPQSTNSTQRDRGESL